MNGKEKELDHPVLAKQHVTIGHVFEVLQGWNGMPDDGVL